MVIINICEKVVDASNKFERCNTELKRKYILDNIKLLNLIMSKVDGYCGSFGTGYPFYVLDSNLEGDMPIILEQIRYNNDLLNGVNIDSEWKCRECLHENGEIMPDLKQICKPCPRVMDSIKPRKVINRLPDIDMWMVCCDDKIESACCQLVTLFDSYDMHTSDVDPIRTIDDVYKISSELTVGDMPKEKLPIDIHIIPYSRMVYLLDGICQNLIDSFLDGVSPYMPIHPLSLRKTWQYDDVAYNFVFDYLVSFTPFNFSKELNDKLEISRLKIRDNFSMEILIEFLYSVSSDVFKRRLETSEVKNNYEKRLLLWKK